MPQKILILNTNYREYGGEDSNIIDEIKFLKHKYSVEELNFSNKEKITLSDVLAFFKLSNYKSNKKLSAALSNFEPDAVYVHNLWFRANLGILTSLNNKQIKIFHKIHNYRFDCSRYFQSKNHLKGKTKCDACGISKNDIGYFNKYYKDSFIKSFFLYWFSKRYFYLLKNINMNILVMSKFQKNYLIEIGIPKDKIMIYPNPIFFDQTTLSSYDPKSKSIVFVGRLEETKGIEEIINTWQKIKFENLQLQIIGSGSLLGYLKNKYQDESIQFLGKVSNESAQGYIKKSRALITATKLYEGQPRVLLEASRFGVPSIYPSFGGMNDFFPNDYELVFNQYDYEDLNKKMSKLDDNSFLYSQSIKIKSHLKDNFDEDKLNKIFSDIFIVSND